MNISKERYIMVLHVYISFYPTLYKLFHFPGDGRPLRSDDY